MQLTNNKEEDIIIVDELFDDFDNGEFKKEYTELEKKVITFYMFEHITKYEKRLGKITTADFAIIDKKDSPKKAIICVNKSVFEVSIDTLFNYIKKTVEINKRSYISSLKRAEDEKAFYKMLNKIQ